MRDDFMSFREQLCSVVTLRQNDRMHFFTTATSHFGIYVSHLVDNIGEGRPKWMYLSCTVQVPFI